jgi:hypothetical protein
MTLVNTEGYTFYVEEEPIYDYDMDDNEIETLTRSILFLSLKKQPYPCVKIDVSKDKHITIAELQLTNYYKSCSIKEKELEQHSGTIVMLKTALTYVIQAYPHVKMIELQDETIINIPTKPLITPRRLLLGQKGWYEEYLGATPKKSSLIDTLRFLRQPSTQNSITDILPPESHNKQWWNPDNIKRITDKINKSLFQYLIGSMWQISAATIRNYNINIHIIQPAEQSGGYHKKLMKIRREGLSGYVPLHQIGRS